MNKLIVKIITGMRRNRESMILKLLSQELIKNRVKKKNIIEINFESLMFSESIKIKRLYTYIMEKAQEF